MSVPIVLRSNCFYLLIPVFLWNIIFVSYLPRSYSEEVFWNDIPRFITVFENSLRLIIFILPVLMKFSIKTKMQALGFKIYLIGLVIYFASWLLQIYLPESIWSKSSTGFLATAYTSLILFIGIGMIGKNSYFSIPHFSITYIILSILFVIFHTWHCYIVFQRL